MYDKLELDLNPHRRLNILTGEWVLVSPHRTKRPWQGKHENPNTGAAVSYDHTCYLCPGNPRADGEINPDYSGSFVFKNDFSALLDDTPAGEMDDMGLLVAHNERGICKVISFSPDHSLTLPELSIAEIAGIVGRWKSEFELLSSVPWIRYIQIFENKGEVMGCSNPHPHGQIWSQGSVPMEITKETLRQSTYYQIHRRSLLSAYLELELKKGERIVYENEHFVVLVPFWAVWPYETMIISRAHIQNISSFSSEMSYALARAIKVLTTKYDNLFQTSFPYSAGMHQSPVNDGEYLEWHWHMHFYPPLLRSATVKKFMVGYEMLANPQRDVSPEIAAAKLREASEEHFKITADKNSST